MPHATPTSSSQELARKARYYADNRQAISAKNGAHYSAHRDHILDRRAEYYVQKRDQILAQEAVYRSSGRRAAAVRARYARDPQARLSTRIRNETRRFFTGKSRYPAVQARLGCTIEELRAHLEAQFLPGMSWATYGYRGWTLDHKRPLAGFDLTDPKQFAEAFHFSNLQPLWSTVNLRKATRDPLSGSRPERKRWATPKHP